MTQRTTCQHCGHEMQEYSRICPLCGGEIYLDPPSGTPKCPRCRCHLVPVTMREQELDLCPECDGLWLDVPEFKILTTEADVYRDLSVKPEFIRQPPPAGEGYLPCARCDDLMNRRNFGTFSGIMIDSCGDHGCWLDADELQHIRAFIAAGKWEEGQDKELIRQANRMRELSTHVSDLEFMQKFLHHWDWKRWLFKGIWGFRL